MAFFFWSQVMFLAVVNPIGYLSNLMSSYFFLSVAGSGGEGSDSLLFRSRKRRHYCAGQE